jgi:hypothetical protein
MQGKFDENAKLEPKDIFVHFGEINITENVGETRFVSEIYVHPEWQIHSRDYDADLAILLLDKQVEFSNFIQPVCLPQMSDLYNNGFTVLNFN